VVQWGDEGKGKIVDFFAPRYVYRKVSGRPNAGHTLYVNDKKVVLHQYLRASFMKHYQSIGMGSADP